MNYIDEIFKRCNLEAVGGYLMYGDGTVEGRSESYYDRVSAADLKLDKWLKENFSEGQETDRHTGFVYSVVSEIKNVYFQIGLQAGFMLAEELSSEK